MRQLSTQLTDDAFEMVAFGQGFASMNWPTKKLEEARGQLLMVES